LGNLELSHQLHIEAITIRRDLKQDATCVDNLASLAAIATSQHKSAIALQYVDDILTWIEANGTDGIEYLWKTYVVCINVLEMAGAYERSTKLLDQAYHALIQQSRKISDVGIRQEFLHQVAAQREIITRFEQKKVEASFDASTT
jgi:hypothetical protein